MTSFMTKWKIIIINMSLNVIGSFWAYSHAPLYKEMHCILKQILYFTVFLTCCSHEFCRMLYHIKGEKWSDTNDYFIFFTSQKPAIMTGACKRLHSLNKTDCCISFWIPVCSFHPTILPLFQPVCQSACYKWQLISTGDILANQTAV